MTSVPSIIEPFMKRMGAFLKWLFILAGIVAPAFMLIFEFQTHQLSGGLFDPMPTPWHAVLLGLIPVTHLMTLVVIQRYSASLMIVTRVLRGLVLAPLLLYVVALGPTHLSALFQCLLGLFISLAQWSRGEFASDDYDCSLWVALAALAPTLALISWWLLGRKLSRNSPERGNMAFARQSLFVGGFVAGVLLLAAVEIPLVRTYLYVLRAVSDGKGEGTSEELEFLRTDRARAMVARLCNAPHPFSSAGTLYAVGPVDIFGPAVHLLQGFEHPIAAYCRLQLRQTDLRRLFASIAPATGSAEPVSSSWRGLSPWELPPTD